MSFAFCAVQIFSRHDINAKTVNLSPSSSFYKDVSDHEKCEKKKKQDSLAKMLLTMKNARRSKLCKKKKKQKQNKIF